MRKSLLFVVFALLCLALPISLWAQNGGGKKGSESKKEKKAEDKKKSENKEKDKELVSAEKKEKEKESKKSRLKEELARVTPIDQKIEPVPGGFGRYMWNLISVLGIVFILGIAYVFSTSRKNLNYRLILWGIGLQFIFALLILHTGPGKMVFDKAKVAVNEIISFTNEGAGFVAGALTNQQVMGETVKSRIDVYIGENDFVYINGKKLSNKEYAVFVKDTEKNPRAQNKMVPKNWPEGWQKGFSPDRALQPVKGISYENAYAYTQWLAQKEYGPGGFIFVFQILTTIIFFASLMAVLYHLGIMQWFVYWMAKGMNKTMGTSGAESLSVAANVFVGQTEAPLVVAPYVSNMTKSELMALMTGGFATIAGGVLVAYVAFGISAGHLLAASVMSAPAALVLAKIFVPETEKSLTAGKVEMTIEKKDANVIDAAANGAGEGMKLALNVAAMLLAFVALIAMMDAILGGIKGGLDYLVGFAGYEAHYFPKDLKELFGYIFFPVALAMGVPWQDSGIFANLIGTKLTLTEFIAFLELKFAMPGSLVSESGQLTTRGYTLGAYALCGFANFGSIAIQLGGIGGIAPDRRHDLAKLGLKAMFAGALASFMTATLAGVMLTPKECDWRYAQDLADRQIESYMDKTEFFPLAEFAKPYYQFNKLYPGENEGAVEKEVKSRLKRIFGHYQKEKNLEESKIFARVFQKRYPEFAPLVPQVLDEMKKAAKESENSSLVDFAEKLKGEL